MTSSAPATDDETTIYPTFTCFDDTTAYLNELASRGATRAELLEYTIVHGIVVMGDGHRFAHAWLEHEGKVLECGIYKGERVWIEFSADEFRGLHSIEEETRYTIPEAARLDHELGYAPWKPEYRALCSSEGEPKKTWAVHMAGECAK